MSEEKKTPQRSVYQINDGETHWVIAESAVDAFLLLCKSTGMTPKTYLEELWEWPSIRRVEPTTALIIDGVERSISKWIEITPMNGFLCSTVY